MTPFLPAEIRVQFPGSQDKVYLNIAETTLIPVSSADAARAYVEHALMGTGDKTAHRASVERCREGLAELLGSHPDEVAITKNVSEALNLFASSLPWKAGDNVVFCPELEHPNNVYVWLNLRRLGVEVRTIEARAGHIPIDRMIERMDARTRIATVSTVSFAPGFRTDVETLGAACRERDVLLLVDAAQSVGVLHTDVRESNIDALAVSTQKGLLGLYGMGFLYCRSAWAERMQPAYLARFGVDLGDAHEASIGDYDFKLASGARRFDLGNYNFLATAAVDVSIQQLLDWDTRRIEPYVRSLTHSLARGFLELGLPVAGGEPGPHLTKIVTVGTMSADHYGTGDERFNKLYGHLVANRVKLSIRRGMLRFSLHVYNQMQDVERVLGLTRDFLKKH